MNRDQLMKHLDENGIDSQPFLSVVSLPMFEDKTSNYIPIELSKSGINLPTAFNITGGEVNFS